MSDCTSFDRENIENGTIEGKFETYDVTRCGRGLEFNWPFNGMSESDEICSGRGVERADYEGQDLEIASRKIRPKIVKILMKLKFKI